MNQGSLFTPKSTSTPSTYLDHIETPVEPPSSSAECSLPSEGFELVDGFRHSCWSSDRLLIFSAFRELNIRFNRVESFRTCGSGSWILRSKHDPEKFRIVPDYCHDRWCVPCSRLRQLTIRRNLSERLGDHPHRFLTLTIRHGSEPLSFLIDKLYAGFRRLRQRALWKDNVVGGASFLELTYNSDRGSWHPHLHCVLEGSYLHRPALVKLWESCTGGSTGVHIRLIRHREHIIDYVSKYVTKPLSSKALRSPGLALEAISCLKNRRMLITFGTWRAWKLTRPPENDEWNLYCHENALGFLDVDRNPESDNVRSMLHTADPDTGIFWVFSGDLPP